jgi:hypothetical protein
MADVVNADLQIGDPPSHHWHEFILEIFGRNMVGTQRSPVGLSANGPNAATSESVKVAESHEPSPQERKVIHDLLAAASAFVVAESTFLARALKERGLADEPRHLTADLYVILQRAGQVGVRLAETAAAGTWAKLLTDRPLESVAVPSPRVMGMETVDGARRVKAAHSLAQSRSPVDDHVVLMVDPMEKSRQRALAKQGLMTILESVARLHDAEPRTLFVMSTVSDLSPVPVVLFEGDDAEPCSPFRELERWFARTLDQVSRAVDTLDHAGRSPRGQAADRLREHDSDDYQEITFSRFFEAINVALRDYKPRMVVALANDTSIGQTGGLRGWLDSRRRPDGWWSGSLAERLDLKLAFSGASVAVISGSPPRAGIESLFEAWSAAGATVQYRCLVEPSNVDRVDYLADDYRRSEGHTGDEGHFPYHSHAAGVGALPSCSVGAFAMDERGSAPVIDRSSDTGLHPPPSRWRLRSRMFTMAAVFLVAISVTVITVLTWGIDTAPNILGLSVGLTSGAALAWSARQWRKLEGSGSLRERITHVAKTMASNGP